MKLAFWKRKKAQVEQAVDEAAMVATDLAEKTMTIGPGGVVLMLGAAALSAGAAYYMVKKRKSAQTKSAKN